MKVRVLMAVLLTAGVLAMESLAQAPVITSVQGNGRLAWTNGMNSNALYRVEWASQANGPWHSFTYQPINTVDAHESTSFEAEVPMFYRVVMMTNQPPAGMVWVDGGEFVMGDTQGVGYTDEVPVHTNFISGFWMDEMEVSKAKWDEVHAWATNHGYSFDNAGSGKANNHPVQMINWYDCVKWCNARSQMEGLTPCYYTGDALNVIYTNGQVAVSNNWVDWSAAGYRLPTEAEWEKSTRGGRQGRLFPWGGGTISHSQANYYSSAADAYDISPTREYHPSYTNGATPYTSPVGSFPANAYGLHDMAGNVIEWCWDWYGDYSTAHATDPRGPEFGQYGSLRVLRSGSWNYTAGGSTCSDRHSDYAERNLDSIGFRCVRGP